MRSISQTDFNSQLRVTLWRRIVVGAVMMCALFCASAWAQNPQPNTTTEPKISARPAADLYLRLGRVGLDAKQVYSIRDGSLDVEDIHISFNDGTIAFTEALDGHVTGALFEGDGEILVVPPSQVERRSMQQFTGAAVLSEQFQVAYFRFSDVSMMEKLQPAMRL